MTNNSLNNRIAQIEARLEAATPGKRDTLCINVNESSAEGVELARHAARDLRFLTAALKEACEALTDIRDNSPHTAFRDAYMSNAAAETLAEISRLAGEGGAV